MRAHEAAGFPVTCTAVGLAEPVPWPATGAGPDPRDPRVAHPDLDTKVVQRLLLPPLIDLLEKATTVQPQYQVALPQVLANTDVTTAYKQVVRKWRNEPATSFVSTVPLLNLESDITEPLELVPGLVLQPLTNSEKEQLLVDPITRSDLKILPPLASPFTLSQCRLALVAVYEADGRDKSLGTIWLSNLRAVPGGETCLNTIWRAITAIRLLHEEDVGGLFHIIRSADQPLFRPRYPRLDDLELPETNTTSPVQLLRTDTAKLSETIKWLEKVDRQRQNLGVALRRFNQTYIRSQPEDMLIDLTIALESTLLAGIEDELSYRLGIRGMALLAGTTLAATEPDLQKVQLLLKVAYYARSKIVHEGKSLVELQSARVKSDSELSDMRKTLSKVDPHLTSGWLAFALKNGVRRILLEYLRRTYLEGSLDAVNQSLDTSVRAGLANRQGPLTCPAAGTS